MWLPLLASNLEMKRTAIRHFSYSPKTTFENEPFSAIGYYNSQFEIYNSLPLRNNV